MSFDVAKNIINRELQAIGESERFDRVEFNFFGGEPLLHFDLIRNVVEWAEAESITDRCFFTATTNGTLINKEIEEWCGEHKEHFALGLSLDGVDDVQMSNRGCSSENIPAEFVKKLWPNRPFKMTISQASLPTLAENVVGLQERGYDFFASLAEGTEWTDENAREYGRQLQMLAEYYLTHRDKKPMHLFLRSLQNLVDNRDKPQRKMCGMGDYSVAYDYDGTEYPCISVTPIVTNVGLPNADYTAQSSDFADEECEGCILKNGCPTCYGQNLVYRHNFAKRDHRNCKMYKTELRIVAQMQADYLLPYKGNLSAEQRKRLDNARTVLEILGDRADRAL